ncbi:hypothetical protein ACC862_37730 [Rhizobium ruizarguesonis]
MVGDFHDHRHVVLDQQDHVKNDPRVIEAYLGVEDEEVEEVIAAVEQLEGGAN